MGPEQSRRRWLTLAVLGVTQLMVTLDATIINIALPRAQVALSFSAADREWVVTAYALSFGSLLLLGGRLGDLWGRRTALLVGLVGFAGASAVGGAATSFTMLVSARAVQGAFGAILAPAALAALTTAFTDPDERARAFSIYGALAGSGAAIGLILGGALTQWASWRWCLYVNLVFALVAVVGVIPLVPGGRGPYHRHVDLLGAVLGSAGLFGVVYGLSHAVTASWSATLSWGSIVAGAVVLVLFVLAERRSSHPLLPLRVVLDRARGGSLAGLFLTNLALFGAGLFLAYYLENSLGYSPLRTGIAFLPMVAAIAVSAQVAAARLITLSGPRPLVPAGMLLAALGLILFTRLPLRADYLGDVLPGLVLLGLGLGLVFAPGIATATGRVAPADAGAASASVNTVQQVGGSVGTALLNTLAVDATARSLSGGGGSALAAARAALHGFAVAYGWAAGILLGGALVLVVLLPSVGSLSAPRVDQASE